MNESRRGPRDRAAGIYSGMLSAAMRPGITWSWLRQLVKWGRLEGYPVEELYDRAANAASLNRSLNVPGLAELERGDEGTVEQTYR